MVPSLQCRKPEKHRETDHPQLKEKKKIRSTEEIRNAFASRQNARARRRVLPNSVTSVGLTRRASTAPSSLQLLVALPNSEFSPKTPSDSPAALTLHLPALGVCLLKARPLFGSTLPQKSRFGMSTLASPEARDALRRASDHPLPLPVCSITPKPKQATIFHFCLN